MSHSSPKRKPSVANDIREINRENGARLIKAGLAIFPSNFDKHPIPVTWQRLDTLISDTDRKAAITAFKDKHKRAPIHVGSTTDLVTFSKLSSDLGSHVWSISCGPSRLFALDCDGAEAVEWLRKYFAEKNVDVSQCPQVRTQSGGWHVYFADPEGEMRTHGRIVQFGDGGIDARGQGGQTVAPGSVLLKIEEDGRKSERHYTPVDGTPDLCDAYAARAIPCVPDAVRELVRNRAKAQGDAPARVSDGETAAEIEKLRSAPILAFDTVTDPTIGFDLDALRAKDIEFAELWDNPTGDHSKDRFNLAKCLRREFDGLRIEHLAAIYAEWEGAGRHDESARGKGLYNDRDIAREFLANTDARKIQDGAAFGVVNDNDESDAPHEHYLEARKEHDAKKKVRKAKAPIMLDAVDYDSNIRKIVTALRPHVPLYIRGRELVTVATIKLQGAPNLPGDTAKRRDPETSAFVPVKPEWLQARATRYLDCRRTKLSGKGANKETVIVAAPPPEKECKLLIASPETWNIPVAHQIVEAPFLTPGGDIVSVPGFHAESGLYLTGAVSLPELPKAPSRNAALQALDELDALLDEFPFVDNASRSGALSMILTLLCRNLADVVPLHAITAPAPGTGKSELGSIATRIAHGRPLPVQAADNREGELAKRIETAVRAGHPVIALDNVNGTLAGDVLCQVISQPIMTFRVLGGHGDFTGTNRASTIATGNNLRLPDDMIRRSILIGLDAELERPEHRQFKRSAAELNAHIAKHRGQLIGAGLTVVRAFVHALAFDEAEMLPPFAGFAAWSAYVRSPLVWLGRADPLATQASIAADDPEGQKRAAIFAAWHALTTGEAMRASDALKKAEARLISADDAAATEAAGEALATLREHVPMGPGRRGDEALAHAIGYYFRRQKGVIAGGLRLKSATDRDGLARWQTSPV